MEEHKITGVVLTSIDYKEKDKLVEIFSAELGKITAVLKGCKGANAKLKFAFQPFCLAEFVVVKKGQYYSITNCYLIDSFFDLTKDYQAYSCGISMLEIVRLVVNQEEQEPKLLLLLINSLKAMTYDGYNHLIVLTKFILEVLKMIGYMLNFDTCSVCGGLFRNKVYLNLSTGALVCSSCMTLDSVELSKEEFNILKLINMSVKDNLKNLKFNEGKLKNTLKTLSKDLEFRFNRQLKSFVNFS